jgi:5-(carboxyamino)imidazole ribonucleotide synthase
VTALVGCIGGGQLGRMLALAGALLDVRLRFLDPAADACAGDVGELVVGPYDDPMSLERLADGADVVTYEFENVPLEAARRVDAVPNARALELGQDRLVEKELFRRLEIPTAVFGSVEDVGVPALVKSRRFGYDGKGQRVTEATEPLRADELAEAIVPFDRELSIVAVRGRDGATAFYPLTENEHREGILAISRAPARDAPQAAAERLAAKLLDALDYVGVLAVELFDVGGELLANEFAPRVHNTGHWTIDGAETNQFENHLRAILGLPLGSTAARGGAVMVNLVGSLPPLERLLAVPGAHVHVYGKEPRPGRKLGHVTLVDADEAAFTDVVALAGAAWLS